MPKEREAHAKTEVQLDRRLRADAQRNEDAVLEAAKAVFAELGVDAPVRDVAMRAGVGMGTLYRRFPKRADLIAGVFRREVDACAAEAQRLTETCLPLDALTRWLQQYSGFIGTKRGLSAALHSGDPAFDTLPDYFRTKFEPALVGLLNKAADAGEIRRHLDAIDLLRAIGNLSVATENGGAEHTKRMIDLLVDGLRFGRANGADKSDAQPAPE
mgnify:CR=1 FL=1